MTIEPNLVISFILGITIGGVIGYNIGIPKGIRVCKGVMAEMNGQSMEE